MKKLAVILMVVLFFPACTTYEGAAYLKNSLEQMSCTESQSPAPDFKTAKADCIKQTVDDEYFKAGVSETTLAWIKEVHRRTYKECMAKKGYACTWE